MRKFFALLLTLIAAIALLTVGASALSGSGTEADPYVINTVDELKFLRDQVNAVEPEYPEYNAPGVYVALGADIDMTGENWTPIGSATTDHGFLSNFDGKTFKIKNLTITNPAKDADNYVYAGLFGVTEGTAETQNVIKNLTIENVTILSDGHIVAAAIAYPYYTKLDNIKVCGDISITGGDYTAGVVAYTTRCTDASNLTIAGNAGSTITGDQTIGGVISDIQMNGGLTANYSNFSASNLTITGTKNVGGISGIISGQTLTTCSVENVALECENARVGIVSGSLGATSTIIGANVENVTGASTIVGACYGSGSPVQAQLGSTFYATLQSAIAAAQDTETVTLLNDVTVDTHVIIGKAITLDLNGKTITNMVPQNRAFTVDAAVKFTINGTVRGSAMVIPAENTTSYGFVKLSDGASVVMNGGSYTGKIDCAPIVRVADNAAANIEMDGVTIDTNWMVIYSNSDDAAVNATIKNCDVTIRAEETGGRNAATAFSIAGGTGSVVALENVEAEIITAEGGSISGVGTELAGTGLTATLKNCTFTQTGPVDNGASPSTAIAVSYGASLTIESTSYSGYSRSLYVYPTGGTITVKGGEYSGDVISHINKGASNTVADAVINIENGTFTGALTTTTVAGSANSYTASINVTGGYFTSDPSAYLASNLVAVASDKAGYTFMIAEKSQDVTVDTHVSTGTSTPIAPDNASDETKEFVQNLTSNTAAQEKTAADAAVGLSAEANALTNNSTIVGDEAIIDAVKGIASSETDLGDTAGDALAAILEEKNITVTSDVTVVVQPYLDITVNEANTTEKVVSVNIEPKYNLVATTDPTNIKTEGDNDSKNAVVLKEAQPMEVDVQVTVTIPLPSGFAADGDPIYIVHTKNDEANTQYRYEGTVSEVDGQLYATFVNPNGFSMFTAYADPVVASVVGGSSYTSLQAAVDAIATTGGTIKLLDDVTVTATDSSPYMIPAGVTLDLNGNTLTGTVIGTLKVNNGTYITSGGYNQIIPTSKEPSAKDVFVSDDAVISMGVNNNGRYFLVMGAGEVTLSSALVSEGGWYTLENQDLTVDTGASFKIPDNMFFYIKNGTNAVINGTLTLGSGSEIRLEAGATLKAPEGLNVTTVAANSVVIYKEGVYQVVPTYTLTVNVTTPDGATIVVKDSSDNEVSAEQGGTYVVINGATYTVTVSKEGYTSESKTFTVEGDTVQLTFELVEIPGEPGEPEPSAPVITTYRITYADAENGSVTGSTYSSRSGRTVTFTVEADEKYVVKSVSVTAVTGRKIDVTDNGDGTYSFVMPSRGVTVEATFGIPFADIEMDHQFYEAIEWVYTQGLMIGKTETSFDRVSAVTRQQVWRVLARVINKEDPGSMAAAKDWAMAQGIADGTRPGDAATREEFITMMWTAFGKPAADTSVLAKYTDADQISDSAKAAFAWATEVGITEGYSDGTMRPAATATRGAFAAILYRYLAK